MKCNNRLITIKLKNIYPNDPVDRLRGKNIVKILKDRGWNIALYYGQKNIDLLIYLDSLSFDKKIDAKHIVLDIQDNHLVKENPASRYIKHHIKINFFEKVVQVLKRDGLNIFKRLFQGSRHHQTYIDNITAANYIICSSKALQDVYKKYNSNTMVIPDAVESFLSEEKIMRKKKNKEPVMCWVGTENNIAYLKIVDKAVASLQKTYGVKFKIISSINIYKRESLKSILDGFHFHFDFVEWQEESVAREILDSDIAIAPLPDGIEKSTNKILTYMALGVPTVCSGAIDYMELHKDNPNSFIYVNKNSIETWFNELSRLITDEQRRQMFAKNGFDLAKNFSLNHISNKYEQLFEKLLGNEY